MIQGMVIADGRRGHELDNKGSNDSAGPNRTTSNPQDTYSETLLGKLVVNPTARDTFTFTAETVRQRVDSNVLSAVNPPTTLALTANDRLERNRFSVDYGFGNEAARFFQTAHVQLYYQDASQDQKSYETRGSQPSRSRDNNYGERIVGGSAFAESTFQTGILTHKLLYGGDGSVDRVTNLRNRHDTGAGEAPFPNKAFPDTDYTLLGAFLQDQISIGALKVTPGVRFDSYRLNVKTGDPLYTGTTRFIERSGAVAASRGALRSVADADSVRAIRSRFSCAFARSGQQQFRQSDLRLYVDRQPESQTRNERHHRGGPARQTRYGRRSPELQRGRPSRGVIGTSSHSRPSAAQAGPPTRSCSSTSISAKRASTVSKGASNGFLPRGFSIKTAMAFTKGSVENTGSANRPLDTVNPFSAVFGLRYEPSEAWVSLKRTCYSRRQRNLTRSHRKAATRQRVSPRRRHSSSICAPDTASTSTSSRMSACSTCSTASTGAGRTSRGIADTSSIKDAYTAPGRNVSVSMKIDM